MSELRFTYDFDMFFKRAAETLAKDIEEDVKDSLGRSSSSPGKPPARRTGTLLRSIESGVEIANGNQTAVVSADTPYVLALEFGTNSAPARPFLRPALRRAEIREKL